MKYYVLTTFISEEPIDDPAAYVAGAVAEMKGCLHPELPERSIDSSVVKALDISDMPQNTTLKSLTEFL